MLQEPYIFGSYGLNECPNSAKDISSEAACRQAAMFLGIRFEKAVDEGDYPNGCVRQLLSLQLSALQSVTLSLSCTSVSLAKPPRLRPEHVLEQAHRRVAAC